MSNLINAVLVPSTNPVINVTKLYNLHSKGVSRPVCSNSETCRIHYCQIGKHQKSQNFKSIILPCAITSPKTLDVHKHTTVSKCTGLKQEITWCFEKLCTNLCTFSWCCLRAEQGDLVIPAVHLEGKRKEKINKQNLIFENCTSGKRQTGGKRGKRYLNVRLERLQ